MLILERGMARETATVTVVNLRHLNAQRSFAHVWLRVVPVLEYEDRCEGLTSSAPLIFHSAILVCVRVSRAFAAQPGEHFVLIRTVPNGGSEQSAASANEKRKVIFSRRISLVCTL